MAEFILAQDALEKLGTDEYCEIIVSLFDGMTESLTNEQHLAIIMTLLEYRYDFQYYLDPVGEIISTLLAANGESPEGIKSERKPN